MSVQKFLVIIENANGDAFLDERFKEVVVDGIRDNGFTDVEVIKVIEVVS